MTNSPDEVATIEQQQQSVNSKTTVLGQPQQVDCVVLPGEDVTDSILSTTRTRPSKKTPKIGTTTSVLFFFFSFSRFCFSKQ